MNPPDLSQIKETFDTLQALVIPVAAIIMALYGWKKTGHIDLLKTLEHAGDVLHVIENGGSIKEAVAEVEHLRGKRLSTKLKRKLTARIETLTRDKGYRRAQDAEPSEKGKGVVD